MTTWLHSTVLATALAATAAVAYAAVSTSPSDTAPAKRADRLVTVPEPCRLASADTRTSGCPAGNNTAGTYYVTVEQRSEGLSVLTKVPVTRTDRFY